MYRLFTILKDLFVHNRNAVQVIILGMMIADVFFLRKNIDFFTFLILIFSTLYIRKFSLRSGSIFRFCLWILTIMCLSYMISGASIVTEKSAVWLILFMGVGSILQLGEANEK